MMKKILGLVLFSIVVSLPLCAKDITIEVSLNGDVCHSFVEALCEASRYKGKPVTIALQTGVYNMNRASATKQLYYVSNTTSEIEDNDPTKHIALYLDGLKNVTIDGRGATLMMNGEMTAFVLDSCENICLKNLSIDSSAPTQTEMEVVEEGADYMITKVHPTSYYRIDDGVLEWYGEGWVFKQGIAQWYDRKTDKTWRAWSPMENLVRAVEMRSNLLYLQYSDKPVVPVGTVFQMRDAIRDEVCGLVYRSKNIVFENVDFHYLGNFGVVCQYSDNITVDRCNFEPKSGSGRTNAGFADFLQVSGCKGLIEIKNSRFVGAHDDPINIHGTHLKVMRFLSPTSVVVRFMHHQTYGFEAFYRNDDIELVDAQSLLPVAKAKVKSAKLISPREMELTLYRPLSPKVIEHPDLVVENTTWTPEVNITGNYFARIPTRGILVTTRRKVVIEQNTFYGMQMSGVLIANDALSWYESGPVHDCVIRDNRFIDCGSPVVSIAPENKVNKGAVHRNISIENNTFDMPDSTATIVRARSVDGITIRGNVVVVDGKTQLVASQLIQLDDCYNIVVE